MRENDTTCYLEQAPDQRRGSNKQPAAAGGAHRATLARVGTRLQATSNPVFVTPAFSFPFPASVVVVCEARRVRTLNSTREDVCLGSGAAH